MGKIFDALEKSKENKGDSTGKVKASDSIASERHESNKDLLNRELSFNNRTSAFSREAAERNGKGTQEIQGAP